MRLTPDFPSLSPVDVWYSIPSSYSPSMSVTKKRGLASSRDLSYSYSLRVQDSAFAMSPFIKYF